MSVKGGNLVVNGNFENGSDPFRRVDGYGGASTFAINSSTPISGNYDIRLTVTTPAMDVARPIFKRVGRRLQILEIKFIFIFTQKY